MFGETNIFANLHLKTAVLDAQPVEFRRVDANTKYRYMHVYHGYFMEISLRLA